MKFRGHVLVALVAIASVIYPSTAEAVPLYKFSSHTFTPCGASGRYGPTLAQCKSAYAKTSWANNSNYFSLSGGIESWTAPATGTYRITAAGADGVGAGIARGLGAIIQANVTLTKGNVYRILVGQAGSNGTGGSGGGGGGTFFTDSSNNPIVIAGGGGGATNGLGSQSTANGQTTTSGSNNSDGGVLGGSNGAGGGSGTWTGGGGGLTGNSTQPASAGYAGYAMAFVNGGVGGPTAQGAFGGFGGGGGTHGNTGGGGGGGGYSGGAGGPNYTLSYNGGGGGSYVTGSATNIATSNGSYAGSSSGITNLGTYNGIASSSTISDGYLTISFTGAVSLTVSTVSGGNVATFRVPFQVRATLGTAGGRVTFFADGKTIGNCNNIYTATTTITCNWMPSTKGSIAITALLVPDSDLLGATAPPINLLVGKRTTLR